MSTLNLLTPPNTPEECAAPLFPIDLELVTFGSYQDIEFRGRKTKEDIKVKVTDLIAKFKLNTAYIRTVNQYLVVHSLRDIYRYDFNHIVGQELYGPDFDLFSDYAQTHELYIRYKGLDILAHNVPKLAPFRDWLESMMDVDLHCYEDIDYDLLGL